MKSFAPIRRGPAIRLLTCLCLLAICALGCSTQETNAPENSAASSAAPSSNVAEENLSGLWTGTTSTGGLVGMAGLTRSIKLVIRQQGAKVAGEYRCSPGNALCRNGDEKGSIEGTANGSHVSLNITLLPDASNCRFIGTLDYNGNGQYTCYLQGRIVEQGTWQASNSLSPSN
jgi:hypothetical protein